MDAKPATNAPPPPNRPSPQRVAGVVLTRLLVRAMVFVAGVLALAVVWWLVRMGLRWLGAPLFFTIERT